VVEVVDSYTIGSGTIGAVTWCAVSIMLGAGMASVWCESGACEYGMVMCGGGCGKVRLRGVAKLVRLILELMAFSCWLSVGWQGASS
jgi:hypothetical protein